MRRPLNSLSDAGRLAAELAAHARAGDLIALEGPLGAGKTTLARALIRQLTGNPQEEVPSPTFTLVQTYETARIPVWHFDLYRIERPEEIFELGFEEAESQGLSLVEWPDRMGAYCPGDYLAIEIDDRDGGQREAILSGHGGWAPRLARMQALHAFISRAGWGAARRGWLQGDASSRAYERLSLNGRHAVLMNAPPMADGPPIRDGKSYSRIAHLAEDMRPFAAIANYLRSLGLSAPEILDQDFEQGFLLIEDLGDDLYGRRLGSGAAMEAPYEAAVEVLAALHGRAAPAQLELPGGGRYHLPDYDREAMMIELDLLPEWFWPAVSSGPIPPDARQDYAQIWSRALAQLSGQKALVLRDYHSPNLLWLPKRSGPARAGLIDFQDAVLGPPAYDLVSLLQDARVDVTEAREQALLTLYLTRAGLEGADQQAFLTDYALMGAQRACKILGIFMRLYRRDGKPGYLGHIPRVSACLERNLSHPALTGPRAWFARHLPQDRRVL
ncbi:MAG: tRNA (adenosine(37)-N6)-threonylcarbamoyltransferase complex ATPase subunit type 1 TsaE [Hyphomicrobiales bacterium]|nr:MAG: tRNA (adenosine(37)-N6)-threonylcarbamoyltransferase complex ATPase subunit type 1 TsaE [Hyphomicrobiales bacterium]